MASLDNGEAPPVSTHDGGIGAAAVPVPADVERALAQIAGIRAARVVPDAGGRIAELHVLAEPGRSPKQLVRDVQSAVLTSFGVTIDYRVVSVVQLDREAMPERSRAAAARPVLRRLTAETASYSTHVSVGVTLDGEETATTARGPATAGLRLVAQATSDAIASAIAAESVEVENAIVSKVGDRQIALVVLRVMTGRGDHVVSGSAIVRRDPGDAVARATLDALNRFVSAG